MTTDIHAASSTVPRDDARDTEHKAAIMAAKGVYYAAVRAAGVRRKNAVEALGDSYRTDCNAAIDAYNAAIDAIYAV